MEKMLVEQLLKGSRNIDHMRKDIHETVSMIIGFVKLCGSIKIATEVNFTTNDYCWTIKTGFQASTNRLDWSTFVKCYIRKHGSLTSLREAYSSTDISSLRMEDVQSVHENLQILVDGVIEFFPELNSKLESILKASETKC